MKFSFETFKEEIKATVADKVEFENLGKHTKLADFEHMVKHEKSIFQQENFSIQSSFKSVNSRIKTGFTFLNKDIN